MSKYAFPISDQYLELENGVSLPELRFYSMRHLPFLLIRSSLDNIIIDMQNYFSDLVYSERSFDCFALGIDFVICSAYFDKFS